MEKLEHSVNFVNLIYYLKDSIKHIDFNDFIDAETPVDDIKFKK